MFFYLKFILARSGKIWKNQKLALFIVLFLSAFINYLNNFQNFFWILSFIAWAIFGWGTLPLAFTSVTLIISIPIFIYFGLEDFAEEATVYTYFNLSALVILEVLRYFNINLWIYELQKWLVHPNFNFLRNGLKHGIFYEDPLLLNSNPLLKGYLTYDERENLAKQNEKIKQLKLLQGSSQESILKEIKRIPETEIEVFAEPTNDQIFQSQASISPATSKLNLSFNPDEDYIQKLIEKAKQQEVPKLSKPVAPEFENVTDASQLEFSYQESDSKEILYRPGYTLTKNNYDSTELENQNLEISNSDFDLLSFDGIFFSLTGLFCLLVFNLKQQVFFTHWVMLDSFDGLSNNLWKFEYLVIKVYNYFSGLNSMMVYNTFFQLTYLFSFLITYIYIKKIAYLINPNPAILVRLFIWFSSLILIFNPLTFSSFFDGNISITIIQSILVALVYLIFRYIRNSKKPKDGFLNKDFVNFVTSSSLLIFALSYLATETLSLVLIVVLGVLGFVYFRNSFMQDEIIENHEIYSPKITKFTIIKILVKLKFLFLTLAFLLGSVFVVFNRYPDLVVRSSVRSDVISFNSPTDPTEAIIGINYFEQNKHPEIIRLNKEQPIVSSIFAEGSLVRLIFIINLAILGWVGFLNKDKLNSRTYYLSLSVIIVFVILGFGYWGIFSLINNLFYGLSINYMYLINGTIYSFLGASVVTFFVYIVSKLNKLTWLYNFSFGFWVVVFMSNFYFLSVYVNYYKEPQIISELNSKCSSEDRVLVYPLDFYNSVSFDNYTDKQLGQAYQTLVTCPIFSPQEYTYRRSGEELKLRPSDSQSFSLENSFVRYISDPDRSNYQNLIEELEANLIKFVVVDIKSSSQVVSLAFNLSSVEGQNYTKSEDIFVFEF